MKEDGGLTLFVATLGYGLLVVITGVFWASELLGAPWGIVLLPVYGTGLATLVVFLILAHRRLVSLYRSGQEPGGVARVFLAVLVSGSIILAVFIPFLPLFLFWLDLLGLVLAVVTYGGVIALQLLLLGAVLWILRGKSRRPEGP